MIPKISYEIFLKKKEASSYFNDRKTEEVLALKSLGVKGDWEGKTSEPPYRVIIICFHSNHLTKTIDLSAMLFLLHGGSEFFFFSFTLISLSLFHL